MFAKYLRARLLPFYFETPSLTCTSTTLLISISSSLPADSRRQSKRVMPASRSKTKFMLYTVCSMSMSVSSRCNGTVLLSHRNEDIQPEKITHCTLLRHCFINRGTFNHHLRRGLDVEHLAGEYGVVNRGYWLTSRLRLLATLCERLFLCPADEGPTL